MSNGGSPHNQTIRENTRKPKEKKVTPSKEAVKPTLQSNSMEKNKAGAAAATRVA